MKNAQSILDGLPKPDFAGLQKVDFAAMMNGLADREPTTEEKRKKLAADAAGLTGADTLIVTKAQSRKTFDLSTSKRAVSAIGRLPELEETFHVLMGGNYHGFDLVIAVHALALARIDCLHVTTLGFNRFNIDHLCRMIDRDAIGSAQIVCSSYFASADTDDFNAARDALTRRNVRLVATRNHSKVLLFAIGERRFAVESSANLRSCNNLEQFTLTNSPALYEFHRAWIERVLTHGAN